MATDKIKTAEEYAELFKHDYSNIVGNGSNFQSNLGWMNQTENFSVFTLYKDTTPVVASNNSSINK
ncbi:hypothetical protein H9X96_03150 [Pedobacter sp. N36a]|uniref:hypothetical protein n=1 Tax=Pedobacter sp. N36a TaxID=2767996 RepID=UPI001656A5E8|nr:hypothetical protein [Pedobacter sp. N36a]MBC8984767.1 hypothetical protein [Pedobacter sp. N36a]